MYFEPGENHWHGAAPDRFMAHIAMQQSDNSGSTVTWGKHVTDEEYGATPASTDYQAFLRSIVGWAAAIGVAGSNPGARRDESVGARDDRRLGSGGRAITQSGRRRRKLRQCGTARTLPAELPVCSALPATTLLTDRRLRIESQVELARERGPS